VSVCACARARVCACVAFVMASENVTLENQLHSAQKNLLFLQQDHSSTLKGLHAEIRRLQQHCTDLTYELTVRSSDPNACLTPSDLQPVSPPETRRHNFRPTESQLPQLQNAPWQLRAKPAVRDDPSAIGAAVMPGGRCSQRSLAVGKEVTLSQWYHVDLNIKDSGEERCRVLHRRCEELEEQLKAKEQENAELLRDLEQKNAMISVLENTIREREKKYLDELKHRSHKLAVLSGELEQRASTISYLSSQLHATKKRLLAGGPAISPAPPAAPPLATPSAQPPPSAADRDTRQPDTPRRRMRKSLSQPLHCEYTELYRLGASDGRRVVLRDTVDAMPDPTPFLQVRELPAPSESPPLLRERPPVIPPIAPAATPPAPSSPAHVPVPPSPRSSPARDRPHRGTAHIGVAHRIHRSSSAGGGARAQPEVETLAVDQVSGEKVVRKHSETDRTV
ncbi:hypothetical protein P4O66_017396, partial [Electrophorus voltai]